MKALDDKSCLLDLNEHVLLIGKDKEKILDKYIEQLLEFKKERESIGFTVLESESSLSRKVRETAIREGLFFKEINKLNYGSYGINPLQGELIAVEKRMIELFDKFRLTNEEKKLVCNTVRFLKSNFGNNLSIKQMIRFLIDERMMEVYLESYRNEVKHDKLLSYFKKVLEKGKEGKLLRLTVAGKLHLITEPVGKMFNTKDLVSPEIVYDTADVLSIQLKGLETSESKRIIGRLILRQFQEGIYNRKKRMRNPLHYVIINELDLFIFDNFATFLDDCKSRNIRIIAGVGCATDLKKELENIGDFESIKSQMCILEERGI